MDSNFVEEYGWSSATGPHSCEYLSPEILSILSDLKVHRVLDVGSGNGRLCSDLGRNGFNVVGVENDLKGVQISKSNYPNLPFYNYGVQDDPTELLRHEDGFDAAVSTEVIEHLFAPHLLPRYCHAVIKDRGYIVLTTPYHGYLKNLALSVFNKWDFHHTALWHGGHIKFWSRKTLTKLLESNGFEVCRFVGVGRIPYFWKSMILIGRKF